MERTHISKLKEAVGKEVLIKGFVEAIRDQGKIKFLVIRDVTGQVQVVVKDSPALEKVEDLTLESVISLTGLAKEEAQAPGGFEIKATDFEVLSKADPELAIPVVYEKSGGEVDVSKRFDYRWLDMRRPEKQEILKVWTHLEKGFREFMLSQDFIQAYSPSFMTAPSESGSEVFEVSYFERKAYLAQSPQFYKQMAMAAGLEKIFMIGPVYRAEPSFTTRHVTEFTGWDLEFSYIKDHYDVMSMEEDMLIAAFTEAKEALDLDIEIPTKPFPKITMVEAKEKLKAAGVHSAKEHDVSPEEEREISRIIKEETGHDFVFLTDWHVSERPFYHMRHEDNPQLTKSFDLIYKGVEITTGAQREHRLEVLKEQALEKGMSLDSIAEYLKFFQYGCPPHGGAGIGPARIVMKLMDLPSIKEATFLPRDVKRLTP
ncbi:aspartate--tRNA(Asn) ligase [candidate division WWE3 bacterium]|nr:aspartate--tRNA(Asn) ligase [candidate division WWE3 bacterium]